MGHRLKYDFFVWNSNLTGYPVLLFAKSGNSKYGEPTTTVLGSVDGAMCWWAWCVNGGVFIVRGYLGHCIMEVLSSRIWISTLWQPRVKNKLIFNESGLWIESWKMVDFSGILSKCIT